MNEDDKQLWKKFCDSLKDDTKSVSYHPLPFPHILDLHGYVIHDAFSMVSQFIEDTSYKQIIIITGKSGQINKEFPHWISRFKIVKRYEMLNSGSYKLYLK